MVVPGGDIGFPLTIAMPAGDRERASDQVAARWLAGLCLEIAVDRAPDDLGDRHTQAARAVPDFSMLSRRELYLEAHHDGISIPS